MPPRLTPAERKLEQARIKAEKELAKQEALKQERRDFLARELTYGVQSWRNIEANFRDFAMKIRIPQLKQQVEAAWHFFEHAVDCKNLIISRQLDELEFNEEDHRVMQQKHIVVADEIMKIFKTQLEELNKDFETRKTNLLQENDELLERLSNTLKNEIEGFQLNMLLMKERNDETLKALNAFRFFTENEEKNDAAMALFSLKERIQNEMDDVWSQIKAVLSLYITSTEEPKLEYQALNTKDKNARKTLEVRLKKTKKLLDNIKKMRDKLMAIQDLSEVTLMKLHDERHYFDNLFKALCQRMREEKQLDFNQLISHATACNETVKWLETKVEKGECTLRQAETCQELETQEEKVTPFRYHLPVSDTEEDDDDDDDDEHKKKPKRKAVSTKIWKDIHGLENFWQKVGDVELKYTNMLREAEMLLRENNCLRHLMQRYLKAMARSHEVLQH